MNIDANGLTNISLDPDHIKSPSKAKNGGQLVPLHDHHQMILTLYIRHLEQGNKSTKTILAYKNDLVHFMTWIELKTNGLLAHLQAWQIQQYLWELQTGQNRLAASLGEHPLSVSKEIPILIQGPKQKWWQKLVGKWAQILSRLALGLEKQDVAMPTKPINLDLKNQPENNEIFYRLDPSQLKQGQRLGVASRRRRLSNIKSLFAFLQEHFQDYQDQNGFSLYQQSPVRKKLHQIKLKDKDQIPTVTMRQEDFNILNESVVKISDRLMIHLLFYAGLRLNELRTICWRDWDPEAGVLTFIRKGGDRHALKIYQSTQTPELKPFFLRHFDLSFSTFTTQNQQILRNEGLPSLYERYQSTTIFKGNHHKMFSERGLYGHLMSLMKRAERHPHYQGAKKIRLGLTPHSFRKGCATWLYQETKDLLFVRDYLNHKDAKITQSYIDTKSSNSRPEAIKVEVDQAEREKYH